MSGGNSMQRAVRGFTLRMKRWWRQRGAVSPRGEHADAATRRGHERARFWSEMRAGQREAAARSEKP